MMILLVLENMINELNRKLLKIGKRILDELKIPNRDAIIQMTKVDSENYRIEINTRTVCHLSNDELTYLEEHRND